MNRTLINKNQRLKQTLDLKSVAAMQCTSRISSRNPCALHACARLACGTLAGPAHCTQTPKPRQGKKTKSNLNFLKSHPLKWFADNTSRLVSFAVRRTAVRKLNILNNHPIAQNTHTHTPTLCAAAPTKQGPWMCRFCRFDFFLCAFNPQHSKVAKLLRHFFPLIMWK